MADSNKPLPPGDSELPLLGGTLRFIKDGFHFIERGVEKHGPVFHTSLFGKDVAILSGADGAGAFVDDKNVQRAGGVPPHVAELLFGKIGLPTLDGEQHLDRKRLVMSAFGREALGVHLPKLQKVVRAFFARWTEKPETALVPELKDLALAAICSTIMSIESPEQLSKLGAEYEHVIAAVKALPVPLPGTAFSKGRAALARVLEAFSAAVSEHQAKAGAFDDGLSRMLAARTPAGAALSAHEATVELHHLIIAGSIIWAWLAAAIVELSRNQPVRDRLLAEMKAAPALSLEALHGMKYLDQFSMEVRRTCPVIHVVFGKSKEAFEFAGKQIPAGWMLMWGVNSSHRDAKTYTDPEKFDPDRFGPERHEQDRHPHAFAPQGAGSATAGHKCAGWEFAPLLLKVFVVELLQNYRIDLQDSKVALDWSLIPPEPVGGLRAKVTRS
jgi:cytochrome P450